MASLRSAYDPRHAEIGVFTALLAARKEYGGKKIVLHDADDRKLSYDDIIRAAFALGSALKKGTRKGEAVGVMLPTGAGAIIRPFGPGSGRHFSFGCRCWGSSCCCCCC